MERDSSTGCSCLLSQRIRCFATGCMFFTHYHTEFSQSLCKAGCYGPHFTGGETGVQGESLKPPVAKPECRLEAESQRSLCLPPWGQTTAPAAPYPTRVLSAGWRASGGLGKGAVPPPRYRGLGKVIATEMWVPLLRATLGLLLGADRVEWSRDRSSPSSPTPSPGHPWPHQCQTGCLQCSPTCGLISRLLLEPNGFGFIAHLAPVEPPRESVFPLCVCIQLSYKGQKT